VADGPGSVDPTDPSGIHTLTAQVPSELQEELGRLLAPLCVAAGMPKPLMAERCGTSSPRRPG
jgi:hypothetical protein